MIQEVNNTGHIITTELDCVKSVDLQNIVNAKDILLDIKALISQYYTATFAAEQDQLKIAFNNGQTFVLTVLES